MRRAREDEKDPIEEDDGEDVVIVTLPKRPRTGPLPPVIFIYEDQLYDTPLSFHFTSDDVVKRKNVTETVVQLAKATNHGPSMAHWLLMWVADQLSTEPLKDIPPAYKADVIVAYMRINPVPDEWDMYEEDAPRVYPGATVVTIYNELSPL